MTAQVFLNEQDLATLGVIVDDPANWLDGPDREYPTLAIPGRQGVVFAADPVVAPRTITVAGTIWPTPQTVANRVLVEQKLKAAAYRALVRLAFDDNVTAPIAIDGVCTRCQIRTVGHPQLGLISRATLTILCPDPTWVSVQALPVSFNATPAVIPTGNLVMGGIIRISAPAWSANVVDVVLSYYSAAALLLQSLTIVGTLTAGTDYYELDLDRQTLVKVSSGGAPTNAIAAISAGDFFSIDSMDGDWSVASYPMLGVTATSGNPSGVWLGAQTWL